MVEPGILTSVIKINAKDLSVQISNTALGPSRCMKSFYNLSVMRPYQSRPDVYFSVTFEPLTQIGYFFHTSLNLMADTPTVALTNTHIITLHYPLMNHVQHVSPCENVTCLQV